MPIDTASVWGNAIKTNKEKMAKQLEAIWQETQHIASIENEDKTPTDFTSIDEEKVQQVVAKIDEAIKDKPITKKFKQKLNYI